MAGEQKEMVHGPIKDNTARARIEGLQALTVGGREIDLAAGQGR